MSSRQKSLNSYFKRKENTEEIDINSSKKSKTNDDSDDIVNDNTINTHVLLHIEPASDIQSDINENNSSSTATSTTMTTTTTNNIQKRSYQTWYSTDYKWLVYEPNQGGFCSLCRDYWKPATPLYYEMRSKTKGVFTTQPFINWKNAPGPSGSLAKHQESYYHKTAAQHLLFKQQHGSVAQQLFNVNEAERKVNRQRLGDLIDAAYFLFKHELPHTTLYAPLLELLSKIDYSKKLSTFFEKCPKNASYDSATTVTELLEATSEIIDEHILAKIREARIISIMADEGTDIKPSSKFINLYTILQSRYRSAYFYSVLTHKCAF